MSGPFCGRCEDEMPMVAVEKRHAVVAGVCLGLAALIFGCGLAVTKVQADRSIADSLRKIVTAMEAGKGR